MMIGAGIAVAAIVLVFVLGSVGPTQCEGYKSQINSLCSAKGSSEFCAATANMVDDAEVPGDECEWLGSQCVLKIGLDWSNAPACKT
ncbi:MAG: hypothetical protein V1493_04345 [Candidatus Diapherotrites archaeon]